MNVKHLTDQIISKKSFLCLGLDSDLNKIPKHLLNEVDPIFEFNKAITHVSNLLGAKDKGYRVLTNIGNDGGQEVPHLHFHIFAGEKIGKMVD